MTKQYELILKKHKSISLEMREWESIVWGLENLGLIEKELAKKIKTKLGLLY